MLISVVNRTNGLVPDSELQRVIRAINRQIQEDVSPHWNRTALLRLEGTLGGSPDPDNPRNLRGQGIIYVCQDVDQEDYLGYHDLNQRGIPFGFVFLDIAKNLEEEWSVTLSHEALEMLMDPEVNLLAKGPHPAHPEREVFHWYELCDAVQSETYEIDGVPVSNFVLPLYFTSTEEVSGRNDFLGTSDEEGTTLRSFGINRGGYIGFYDPLIQDHDTYVHTHHKKAEARLEIKLATNLTRRAQRYTKANLPGGIGAPQASTPVPEFECFAIQVAGPEKSAQSFAEKIASQVLGKDYDLRCSVEPGSDQFELFPKRHLGVDEAWDLTYRLRETPGVVDAEPLFVAALGIWRDRHDPVREPSGNIRASGISIGDLPEAKSDPEWSLKQIRAHQAWDLFPDPGSEGAGVRIGHPDTGYQEHPEIWTQQSGDRRIDVDRGFDFVDNDKSALDPLIDDQLLSFPGHGTGTASVIMSAMGPENAGGHVSGVAPAAHLAPLRVSHSVVLLSMGNLIRAIHRAIDQGCHVISISLGGFWSRSLLRAVRRAEQEGVIVLAAAGNYVGIVAWPAAFDEVIAVAGTNVRRLPWWGSSRGRSVDISAPGESVWRATARKKEGNPEFKIGMGDGTSYSVSATAGVAALWLSLKGRDKLIRRFGKSNLTGVFREILKSTAQLPENWDTRRFGAGIVNAEAVLKAELPKRPPPVHRAHKRRAAEGFAGMETFANLFEAHESQRLCDGLCRGFGLKSDHFPDLLEGIGDELLFFASCDPDLRRSIARAARSASVGRRAAAVSGPITEMRRTLRRLHPSRRLSKVLKLED